MSNIVLKIVQSALLFLFLTSSEVLSLLIFRQGKLLERKGGKERERERQRERQTE